MKKFLTLCSFVAVFATASAQKNLVSDPAHSVMQFTVTHLGFNDIPGNFVKSELNINANEADFTKSTISFNVDVHSIDTRVEARDNHLKSEDFFHVEKFPNMNFVSTSIIRTKVKNQYVLNGNLTMHGVTKPVSLTLNYKGSAINPMSNKNTHFYQVVGELKRSDFGVGTKFPEAVISDNVRLKGDFETLEKNS